MVGLPISVLIGWTLATPPSSPAAIGAAGGTGGIGAAAGSGGVGAAPEHTRPRPVTTVPASAKPKVLTPTLLPAKAPTAAPVATTAPPVLVITPTSMPTLDMPPVPTPTEIVVTPTSSPSTSESADPSMPTGDN
ncbi:hypothetical protein Adu01nite_10580 [Paractinoplanes durhamensis]|uniref:Uncharacterized protein n=1 Tax=Paractinoplanes durhamensis TaxID=113563 RepID=A0ABQ3YQ39_9ACTN|nr:hypothetical protein Adu01nite_10580 [Actinoplanes durhamensis]